MADHHHHHHDHEHQQQYQGLQEEDTYDDDEVVEQALNGPPQPPFNPDEIPPDWTECHNHLRAAAFGKTPEKYTPDPQSGEAIEKEPYGLCEDTHEFKQNGCGYPLYFEFIRYSILILLALFAISGVFNLVTNLQGSNCADMWDNLDFNFLSSNSTNTTTTNSTTKTNTSTPAKANATTTKLMDLSYFVEQHERKHLRANTTATNTTTTTTTTTTNTSAASPSNGTAKAKEEDLNGDGIISDEEKDRSDDEKCTLVIFSTISSIGNKLGRNDLIKIQHWLNLAAFLVVMIILQIFRRRQRITSEQCDAENCTASDYTCMVQNIPSPTDEHEDIAADLKDHFQYHIFEERQLTVVKVNLCYVLDDYYALQEKKNAEVDKKQDILKYRKKNKKDPEGSNIQEVEANIKNIKAEIKALEREYKRGANKKFANTAFISFNTQEELQEVLEAFDLNFYQRLLQFVRTTKRNNYKGKNITVQQAPEPSDVNWANMGKTTISKVLRRIFTFLVTLGLLCGSFWAIVAITQVTADMGKSGDVNKLVLMAVSMGASAVIVAINKVLAVILTKLVDFEQYSTKTKWNSSLATKLGWAQFFNTALITFIVAWVVHHNYFSSGGMIETISAMFVSNAWMGPFLSVFDVGYFITKIGMRKYIERDGAESTYTQAEANAVFEGVDWGVAQRYANIMKTLLFASFYAAALPSGLVISAVGLFFAYWADKYVLTQRSIETGALSDELSLEMTEMMEYMIPLYAIGNIAFDFLFMKEVYDFSWVILGVALLHAALPMDLVNKALFKVPAESITDETYSEARPQFWEEYDRSNPATRVAGIEDFNNFKRGYNKAAGFGNAFAK